MFNESFSRRSFLEKSLLGATAGAGIAALTPSPVAADIDPVKLAPGEKLKVGIIGCGNRSRDHIASINRMEEIEIAALCDLLPEMMDEKKQLIRSGARSPQLYADYHKMLLQPDLHAAIVVVPNNVHKECTVASFEAKKHVLCEKPLALTIADCRTMIAEGEKAKKVLQVGTQGMNSPSTLAVGKAVHEGALGNLLYAWISTFRSDWRKLHPDPAIDSKINWRMNKALSGGVIYEQGIHTLAAFTWFLKSEPVELAAMGGYHNKKLEQRDSYDHSGVLVRFANGALLVYGGNIYSSGAPREDCLFGDAGTLVMGNPPRITTGQYWAPYRATAQSAQAEGTPNVEARAQGQPRPARRQADASSRGAGGKVIEVPEEGGKPSQYVQFFKSVTGEVAPFPTGRDHLPALQIARGSLIATESKRVIRISEVD
jgi:predicted dehydrogenase